MNKRKAGAVTAILAALIAILTAVSGLVGDADAAYGHYGQADLEDALKALGAPDGMTVDDLLSMTSGSPAGTVGSISNITLDGLRAIQTDADEVMTAADAITQSLPQNGDGTNTYIVVIEPESRMFGDSILSKITGQVSGIDPNLAGLMQQAQSMQSTLASEQTFVIGGLFALLGGLGLLLISRRTRTAAGGTAK